MGRQSSARGERTAFRNNASRVRIWASRGRVRTIPSSLHHSDLRPHQAHAAGETRHPRQVALTHSPRPTPHPAAPAGASGGSARPSWGPAPSAWTFSHLRGSFGRTSRRGKPGPRRRGRRRLRRTSHCIGSRRARVAPATSRPSPGRRAASVSAVAPGRRGGPNGQGRGRKAVSTRNTWPRPMGASDPPSGATHAHNLDCSRSRSLRPRGDARLVSSLRSDLQSDCCVFRTRRDPALMWAASPPGNYSPQKTKRCNLLSRVLEVLGGL